MSRCSGEYWNKRECRWEVIDYLGVLFHNVCALSRNTYLSPYLFHSWYLILVFLECTTWAFIKLICAHAGGLTENDFILAAKINKLPLDHLLRRKAAEWEMGGCTTNVTENQRDDIPPLYWGFEVTITKNFFKYDCV